MKRLFKGIGKILTWLVFILAEFILIFFNSALWIRLDPPASALLTMPKLMYPNIVNKAVWVYGLMLLALLLPVILHLVKEHKTKKLSLMKTILTVTIFLVLINSLAFMQIIRNTNVVYTYEVALTAAMADSCTQFDIQGIDPALVKVDGVIAFYPVVDMFYNYNYFTAKLPESEGFLDRLGDKIFSLQDVNGAKSIHESHQKVMNNLLGGYPDDPALKEAYRISSPTCLINSSSPPVFLIQGAHDSMTPIEPTREMFNKYKEMGLPAAMLELPCTDHAFDVIFPEGSIIKDKVVDNILIWLETL